MLIKYNINIKLEYSEFLNLYFQRGDMMVTKKNNNICKDHKLIDTENILYWMNTDYIFYYSCENCTKCNKCNKVH